VAFRFGMTKKLPLPSGALSCLYLFGYSLGRIWIEGLRIDPLCVGALPPACEGGFRMAQLMSGLLMLLGAAGLAWIYNQRRKQPDPA
jgi:phosphatidylglycerol:prolipoprotein diacylglycerol transferase